MNFGIRGKKVLKIVEIFPIDSAVKRIASQLLFLLLLSALIFGHAFLSTRNIHIKSKWWKPKTACNTSFRGWLCQPHSKYSTNKCTYMPHICLWMRVQIRLCADECNPLKCSMIIDDCKFSQQTLHSFCKWIVVRN